MAGDIKGWEYCTLEKGFIRREAATYSLIRYSPSGSRTTRLEHYNQELGRLGAEGWEMAGAVHESWEEGSFERLYFKRRLQ